MSSSSVDLMGVEPIAPILQGSVASIGMQAQLQRSARELNPVFRLTTAVCCRNTCRPSLFVTTAFGLHPPYRSAASVASRMESNHRRQHVGLVSCRWTTGPQ